MSWNTSSGEPVAKDALDIVAVQLAPDVQEEQTEQVEATLRAIEILASAVGRPGDKVMVTTSGHTNPGHGPRAGWANETITVTVTAAPSE